MQKKFHALGNLLAFISVRGSCTEVLRNDRIMSSISVRDTNRKYPLVINVQHFCGLAHLVPFIVPFRWSSTDNVSLIWNAINFDDTNTTGTTMIQIVVQQESNTAYTTKWWWRVHGGQELVNWPTRGWVLSDLTLCWWAVWSLTVLQGQLREPPPAVAGKRTHCGGQKLSWHEIKYSDPEKPYAESHTGSTRGASLWYHWTSGVTQVVQSNQQCGGKTHCSRTLHLVNSKTWR